VLIIYCNKENINPQQIVAIGNHGQTIYHAPKKYSWQLGNNTLLSQKTGITVIGDFRSAKIFLQMGKVRHLPQNIISICLVVMAVMAIMME
jgi:hypothetical protein